MMYQGSEKLDHQLDFAFDGLMILLFENANLRPSVFAEYFTVVKDKINWKEIKYNNPATQELLEKILPLI